MVITLPDVRELQEECRMELDFLSWHPIVVLHLGRVAWQPEIRMRGSSMDGDSIDKGARLPLLLSSCHAAGVSGTAIG